MLTCNLQGGLGNQLFQIFTTIAYSLKTNQAFFFINRYQLTSSKDVENGATIRYSYWSTFLNALNLFVKDQDKAPKLDLFIKEQSFHYDPSLLMNLLNNQHSTKMLVGYFQSSKYFDNYKEQILRLLKIPNKQLIMKTLYENQIDFNNTISVHFRLGDYKKLPHVYPILSGTYYIQALNLILNQSSTNKNAQGKTILYFCEDDDYNEVLQIIIMLQPVFTELLFERADNRLSDWEQMLLMSSCRDNIIANSTFSWWGAYLNPHPCKTVCYPETWFQPTVGHNTLDLCPDDWISISNN